MRKIFFLSMVALCALMVSCSKPVQETEGKLIISKPASHKQISALQTASSLAVLGFETQSPTALLEAANIFMSNPTKSMNAESAILNEVDEELRKTIKISFEPADLIAAAKEYADGDEVIETMISRAETKLAMLGGNAGVRGCATGSEYLTTTIKAGGVDVYELPFTANQFAEIAVMGSCYSDLDLYVYDENDNLVVSDCVYTDNCYVCFTPSKAVTYKVKVINRDSVINMYAIAVN